MPDERAPGPAPSAETDEVALLGGRVRLRQRVRGYRAGLDAALLAAAVAAAEGERVVELGCGAGGALLPAAVRNAGTVFTGVEREAAAVALARGNAALNGLEARVTVRGGAVADGFAALGEPRFDAAFSNPPFFDDPAALRAPAPERRGAWMADDGLAAWCAWLLAAVRDGGRVTVVHRADRLGDLLAALGERCGGLAIRPVHPFADAPAKRVLVRAVRGSRTPLALLPPLVLHTRDAPGHTPQADAVLRGEARLEW